MIAIVGSGVIGLAVAEYYSRTTAVTLYTNNHPLTGSKAAAAVLATKGQLFARDPHFALKLEAKKRYKDWIGSLCVEIKDATLAQKIYREGVGVERFADSKDCDRQLRRVIQPQSELSARGFEAQPISRPTETEIHFEREAWIDGPALLKLLNAVLEKRGVKTVQRDARGSEFLKQIREKEGIKSLLVCAGAWTPQILSSWGIDPKLIFSGQMRISIGSTFWLKETLSDLKKHVLVEDHGEDFSSKVTLSGDKVASFSSTMVRISEEELEDAANSPRLYQANAHLLEHAKKAFSDLPANFAETVTGRTGLRIGFGHSEIVIRSFPDLLAGIQLAVCAGAHKSGFLFAPLMGEQLHKLHS